MHILGTSEFIFSTTPATGTGPQLRPAMTPGATYFVAMTYDGTTGNVSKIYFNSPNSPTSHAVTGPTATSTAAINLGLDGSGSSADLILSQPAIYYSLIDANVQDLLLGNTTPAALGAVWCPTLAGTTGTAIQAGDAGLDNHLGSLGNGTGNEYVLSSINPVHGPGTITYAADLAYSAPFQVQAYGDTGDRIAGKSNAVVFLMGNLAGTAIANLINVDQSHLPVVRVNGSTVALNATTPVVWTDADHTGPWAVLQLTQHYGPTDVLDYTAPFGSFTTALGLSAPVISPLTIPNFCGQDALGYFGVTPFAVPEITMPMGMNLAQPNSINYWGYCATKNARYRCSGPLSNTADPVLVGTDGAGAGDPTLPYSWNPAGSFRIFYWNTGNNNGIEINSGQVGYPSPVGTHSAVFDDVNAGTTAVPGAGHLVPVLFSQNGTSTCTVTFLSRTVVGITVTISYNVQYVLDGNGNNLAHGYNCALFWTFSSTVGKWAKDNTISNFWLFAPGDEDNDRSDPVAMSHSLHTAMTASSNGNGPATLRFIDSIGADGSNNFQDPADLQKTSNFAWGGGAAPTVHVVQIRTLNTNASDGTYPWVSNRIYDRLLGVDGTDAVGPYLDFSLNHNGNGSPTDNGEFMNANAEGITPQGCAVLEFVCDAPHGLRSGDVVTMPNSFGLSAANAPITGGDNTVLTGTATVTNNATTIVFTNAPSPALAVGQGLLLDATTDPSRQSYDITSGSGTSYNFTPKFLGTTTSAAVVQKTATATFNNVNNPIWVTGATTFCMEVGATFGCTSGTKIQRVNLTVPMTVSLTVQPYSKVGCLSYGFAARASSYWPGCKPWIPIHPYMQDSCYNAIADEMAPLLLANAEVIVECGDENWNSPGFLTGTINATYGRLLQYLPGGTTTNDGFWTTASSSPAVVSRAGVYAMRTAYGCRVLQARFDTYGKGIKVITMVGTQYTNYAVTSTIITFAKTLGTPGVSGLQQLIPIGAMAHAPYTGAVNAIDGVAGVTFTNALNSAVGNWGAPEIHCLYRLRQKYCTVLWDAWSSQIAVLAGYGGPPANGQINGKPALYNYEAAVTTFSPTNFLLNHDCWYHPEMYYSVIAMLQSQQDGDFTVPGSGAQLSCLFTWGGLWGNGGGGSVPVFNHTVYGSQPFGNGANNLYILTQVAKDYPQATGNGLCNDHQNQNVLVPALQTWWAGVVPPPPPPPPPPSSLPPARRWFPGLRSPRFRSVS